MAVNRSLISDIPKRSVQEVRDHEPDGNRRNLHAAALVYPRVEAYPHQRRKEMIMRLFLPLVGILALWLPAMQVPGPFPVLQGPYLGQKPPGLTPQLFAPGIVSTGMYERDMAASSDGKEIFYGVSFGRITTILSTRQEKGGWTEPQVTSFASDSTYLFLEPSLAADGKTMFFLSNRPPAGQQARPGWQHQNIWISDRRPDGSWGEPYDPGPPVNTEANEFFPSVTRDGTLYFTRSKPGEEKTAIYRTHKNGGKYAEPEMLPPQVNGEGSPYNACIAPDETFLIACVSGRKDSVTAGLPNYYVFFRGRDDKWSEGLNLGAAINMPGASAISPSISPDLKYFFFASNNSQVSSGSSAGRLTFSRLLALYNSPQNGNSDIYWVDAALIRQREAK
jgi:hypothetical protein